MKLSSTYLFSLAALLGCAYADSYKELFTVNITEDSTRNYTVEGHKCDIEMQYFSGSVVSDVFNGETRSGSSLVYKNFKDGHTESRARYILLGKDSKGECDLFIEDNGLYKENQTVITKPTIITTCEDLAWLQTADVQGRVEDQENGKTVKIMWNESNTSLIPYPTVTMPDNSRTYDKKLFTFDIGIGSQVDVIGPDNALAVMIEFTCTSPAENFKATGLDTFVDTRMQFKGQIQTLSARYILQGKDDEGRDCKVYIENNGVDDFTNMITEPFIVTDNPKWAWIESAPLHGSTSWSPNLQIHLWTVNDPSLWTEQPNNDDTGIDSEIEVEDNVEVDDNNDDSDSDNEN
ncbi:hypothetical protein PIROE2DRAFT_5742 [Piromyces sp. E2]|nr:hypothetical protein PIROE2DRAFT_5742 [Piromyces sp. E2]|eukprot:OUM66883.1 hypothetical protein PIROE2DRAFT_5742 [Piromyces sp. E2]